MKKKASASKEDEFVTPEEFHEMMTQALQKMYTSGYNEALHDILEVIQSGANVQQVIEKARLLRKLCSVSSPTNQ